MPSTVIKSFKYDEEAHVLTITFISGVVYDYIDVPEEVYEQMKASFSKGVFFNQHIKDKYEWRKFIGNDSRQ